MIKQPVVGVIIPAYNAEAHIDAALASARAQTYTALDIVVVDDGSTDATAERVGYHACQDARVRMLRQPNQGVAAARNRAIAATQASLIAPLDADDLWAPQKIARHVAQLRKHPEAGLAYSWWVSLDEAGRVIGQSDRWGLYGDVFQALLCVNFVGNASVPVYRRDALEAAGGYVSYRADGAEGCEDWDLTLRVAERAPFCLVASYLTGYRSVSQSMSNRVDRMLRSYDRILAPLRARHPEVPDEVYRWSRSNFMMYLGTLCYNQGALSSAIRLLCASIRTDPPAALCTTSLKKIFKSALRKAARPVTRHVWPTQHDWERFRRRTRRKAPPLVLPPEAYPTLNDAVESWSWKPYKPYDRIRMQRWNQAVDASSSYVSQSPISS
ncbi:MAG: glycosyltransferase family A protein [Longimonas sp.]|uniref:glycosyltransferase family 2 protein n=1 Tax=Longimonas sp. TaxID=2039626 RepID=UPI0033627A7A